MILMLGLSLQGIYRLSGNAATITRLKTEINKGNYSELLQETTDVNAVSGLLKCKGLLIIVFFRELLDPLIPFDTYERFIASMRNFLLISGIENYDDRLIAIKTLVQALPKENYTVLEYLMQHLVKIASFSEKNKMEPSNLAIVFGYSVLILAHLS